MMNSLKRLWQYLKPYKKQLLISVILLFITVSMVALAPLVEGFVTTQLLSDVSDMKKGILSGIQFDKIIRLMIILFVIYVINTSTRLTLQYLLSHDIQNATYDLRLDVKKKMSRIPIAYYDKHTVGDLMSCV